MEKKNISVFSVIENLETGAAGGGDVEESRVTVKGLYTAVSGGTYPVQSYYEISYTESAESGDVFSNIRITSDSVTLKKEGAIKTVMEFKAGEQINFVYSVPPYSLDASLITDKIRIKLNSDGGRVDIHYRMNIGGADKKVWLKMLIM